MPFHLKTAVLLWLSISGAVLGQSASATPARDPRALEVLRRVIKASGMQDLRTVVEVKEDGDAIVYRDKAATGQVSILEMGSDHFRMDINLSDGRRTWLVNDGLGTATRSEQGSHMTSALPVSSLHFAFPLAFVVQGLCDPNAELSFIAVESENQQSVYRVRFQGEMGSPSHPVSVTKDLLIDALTFEISSVEDRPFPARMMDGGRVSSGLRKVSFGDYRSVNGVRVPFRIDETIFGQKTLSLQIRQVVFDSQVSTSDFAD